MSQPPGPNGFEPDPDPNRPAPDAPGQSESFGQAEPGQPSQTPGYGQDAGYGQTAAYGQPSAYGQPAAFGQPYSQQVSPAAPGRSPVLMGFPEPGQQSRVTVAFRYLLLIPHLIMLAILGIAAEICVIIGWFAALFTGQLPTWAHDFLTGVVRWQARAFAYLYLLTDDYPPFSLEDEQYPVRLLAGPAKLNRLAVFFRLILAIPAAIVAVVLSYGLVVVSFFIWLIALVAGQLPVALHQAVAAVVRYQARYSGFLFMITSEYPKGLYGDGGPAMAGQTGVGQAGVDQGLPDQPVFGQPAFAQAGDTMDLRPAADPWRLTLTSGARRLVTTFVVLGALFLVGYGVLIGTLVGGANSTVDKAAALTRVIQANDALGQALASFPTAVTACNQNLPCVTKQDRGAGEALQAFARSISLAGVPSSGQADAARLASDSNAAGSALEQLGSATSVGQYQSLAASDGLQTSMDQLSLDYSRLVRDLGGHTS